MVDLTSFPPIDPLRNPSAFAADLGRYNGPVIEMDARGTVIARSVARFRPAPVSLAPDGEHFAILAPPVGDIAGPGGLYIGAFHQGGGRNLARVGSEDRYETFARVPSIDWSPRGDSVLFSDLGTISLVDIRTGLLKRLAEGGAATWSPSGDWISYVTLKSEVALLNPSTGETKRIDPGKEMQWTPKWSPDGRYLLIPEGEGSHVYEGCLWVYRISDGAWAPLLDFGAWLKEWYWVDTGPSRKQG
jgi:hypothetical protein